MQSGNEFADDRVDKRPKVIELFANLKRSLPELDALLQKYQAPMFEDYLYRFYHHSFKVYSLQGATKEIVAALEALLPGQALNKDFSVLLREGTGKRFELEHNQRWLSETRPIVEAFFHARYFLEMAVHYGQKLQTPPRMLPSGWAALLYLYNLR